MRKETESNEILSLEAAVEVLKGRSASYRLFSRLFLSPLDEEGLDKIAEADYAGVAASLAEGSLLAQGLGQMGKALRKRNTGTRQKLATDFTMCFDGVSSVGDEVAVPYASVYLSETGLLNQEPRNEVYHLYLSEAAKLNPGIFLPEDHLAFELDFLAFLSDEAVEALSGGAGAEEARRLLTVSRSFITGNILTWYGMFSERALKLLQTKFYQGLLKATEGYLELDLATIDDLLSLG